MTVELPRIFANQIRSYQDILVTTQGGMKDFPLLSIDTDSYIVQAEIHSGLLSKDLIADRHCIAIGKVCSLADKITFMIDQNYNYRAVSQGFPLFLGKTAASEPMGQRKDMIKLKGSIIIQNDVWVGYGVTIMSGVTLHNGCIVAANSVVTKDVPPYTIVGGNPAKILCRRFDEESSAALQKIAWWDWPENLQNARKNDFALPVEEFVKKYLPEADEIHSNAPPRTLNGRTCVLLVPDVKARYPLYPKVLKQYLEKDRPGAELLIYLPEEDSSPQAQKSIETILEQSEDRDSYVTLQTGRDLDERMLFQMADYFVTTRCRQTVHRTCLADLYDTKLLYGTDEPIFPDDLC